MPLTASTKDCTQLTDAELAEMGDLCARSSSAYELGHLSKQVCDWVLVTHVHDGDGLVAFSFSTLERIGGTPAILLGLAHVARVKNRQAVLTAVMAENYRRALMAFPDEDVLVGTRLVRPDGFLAFDVLVDHNPRPGHRSSGEERAWGRRLAKRFGLDTYDDRAFVARGDGAFPNAVDFEGTAAVSGDLDQFFAEIDTERGDSLISFGWIMAEELLNYGS